MTTSDAAYLGRGWTFPPSFGAGGADVELSSGTDAIAQSIRLLLQTQPGERVMRPSVGAGLESVLFSEVDRESINAVVALVTDAILFNEPRVHLDLVEATPVPSRPGLLQVSITYTVRSNNSRFNLVFPFSLTEASAGVIGGPV